MKEKSDANQDNIIDQQHFRRQSANNINMWINIIFVITFIVFISSDIAKLKQSYYYNMVEYIQKVNYSHYEAYQKSIATGLRTTVSYHAYDLIKRAHNLHVGGKWESSRRCWEQFIKMYQHDDVQCIEIALEDQYGFDGYSPERLYTNYRGLDWKQDYGYIKYAIHYSGDAMYVSTSCDYVIDERDNIRLYITFRITENIHELFYSNSHVDLLAVIDLRDFKMVYRKDEIGYLSPEKCKDLYANISKIKVNDFECYPFYRLDLKKKTDYICNGAISIENNYLYIAGRSWDEISREFIKDIFEQSNYYILFVLLVIINAVYGLFIRRILMQKVFKNQLQDLQRLKTQQSFYHMQWNNGTRTKCLYDMREMISLYEDHFAVMAINLNNFKFVNYAYSAESGDLILKQVAEYLYRMFTTRAYWIDGDRFVIIVDDSSGNIAKIAENIKEFIQHGLILNDNVYEMSCKIGISYYPSSGKDVDTIIDKALIAAEDDEHITDVKFFNNKMLYNYTFKNNVYNYILKEISVDAIEQSSEVVYSLTSKLNDYIRINLRIPKVIGGDYSVREIFDIVDGQLHSNDIMLYNIKKLCNTIHINDQGGHVCDYAVSISVREIGDSDLIHQILDYVKNEKIDTCRLIFELYQTEEFGMTEAVLIQLKQLQQEGVRVILAEGFNCFASLQKFPMLPLYGVCVEKYLIEKLLGKQKEYEFTLNLIEAIRSLGINLIADGVDDIQFYQCIIQVGFQYASGMYYGKVLNTSDLLEDNSKVNLLYE